eukprot:Em0017g592a
MAGCSIDANFQQSSAEILPDIGENPNHPIKYNFPKRAFGVKEITHRSFQPQWFQTWSWIHYDEGRDIVFCSICVKAARSNKLKAAKTCDVSFISRGYCNWKDATGEKGGFCRHEASGCHKTAVEAVVTLPITTGDIGELLSSAHAKEKASNQKNLMTVAWCLREAKYFTIMADEVTDASNREQVVVCFRWVDSDFEPHKDFVGLHKVDKINADTLVAVIKDVVLRMNLDLHNCRGQCYDGAASMAGSRTGTATQLHQVEERAIFTHCYGHALNLAVADVVKESRMVRDVLDTVREITKLLKYSPRSDSLFEQLKSSLSPGTVGFRTLFPTRWTVFWDEARDITSDSENRARITGVKAQMEKFEFLFGLCLGECILRHTDNLRVFFFTVEQGFWHARKIAECYQESARLHDSMSLACIRQRFDQPAYRHLENLLTSAANGTDYQQDLNFIAEFYGADMDKVLLQTQMELFRSIILSAFPTTANVGIRDIVQHVCTLSSGVHMSITQVSSLVRLLLVMPATNAVSERSASALRRVKSYLRTTMTDKNNLLVLHVHKDRCDSLVLEDCLNKFVCGSERRLSLFGKF